MNIALVGYGKMGRAVERVAAARGHAIVAVVGRGDGISRDRLAGADVAIEFTGPDSAAGNLVRLAESGVAAVSGSTGWLERLPEVRQVVERHGAALLHSANFSIGVQLFLRTAEELARRFAGRAEFEGFVTEAHHSAKKDAPSGTALRLVEWLRRGDASRPWPVTSIRGGHVPGTHEVTLDAVHETVRLSHEARSRDVFAAGAVAAAEWLRGKKGVFTFDQMLFGEAL
jgi:4-hydroxy-tetrahydrodipicolinate reductase